MIANFVQIGHFLQRTPMEINTTRFGIMNIEERSLIHFPWGIPGFEELKRYVLLEHGDGIFHWLQSADDPDVAFLVCSPDVHRLRYRVPPERLNALSVQDEEDLAILNLVSLDRSENCVRFHIRSPLLVNTVTRTGQQWNMDQDELKKYTLPPNGSTTPEGGDFIVWQLERGSQS